LLDAHRKLCLLAVRKRQHEIDAAEVNIRAGGNEEGGARAKGLEQTALATGVDELVHGELALDDIDVAALAHEVEHAGARDALEDAAAAERRGDELAPPSLVDPQHEEVAPASLRDVALVSEQPQDLVVAAFARLGLRDE